MKKLFFAIIAVSMMAGGFSAGAQESASPDCIKYASFYKENYKIKDYEHALPQWRSAFAECPGNFRETIYTEGITMYRSLISKNARNSLLKEAYLDTLVMLYDKRIENYPKSEAAARVNRALDIAMYKKDDAEAVYNYCRDAIDCVLSKENVEPKSISNFPNILFNGFKNSVTVNSFDPDKILSEYSEAMDYLDECNLDPNKVATAKASIESIFVESGIADCDNIIALYTPKFEADPENVALAGKIVKLMNKADGCINNDLYVSAVNVMHTSNPSYMSAYSLFKLYQARDEYDKAMAYGEEAVRYDESDAATDARYYYELAQYAIVKGKYSACVDYALKSVKSDDSYAGKSYILCGKAWASVTAAGDPVQKVAPYWVAIDYINKAKAADASLAEECNNLISAYSRYNPEVGDAFMYGYTKGQAISVSAGGMSATTTVRTR